MNKEIGSNYDNILASSIPYWVVVNILMI